MIWLFSKKVGNVIFSKVVNQTIHSLYAHVDKFKAINWCIAIQFTKEQYESKSQ